MKESIELLKTKAQALPRARLGFFPTPLHRLDRLSEQLGINLYIKRDDLTGMNLFGGNKIRKLEYLMGDIVRQGYDTVLTYGAVQSNHAMQTATACRRLGLHPVLCLNPCSERDARNVRANLLLNRILGAEVHVVDYVPDEPEAEMKRRRQAMGRAHMDELARAGRRCYELPSGGASALGSVGYVMGYAELMEQCQALRIAPDYVFSATGTGGTLGGMVGGHLALGDRARVIGIADSPLDDDYEQNSAELCNGALALLSSDARATAADIHVDRGYYAPGYEQPSAIGTRAIHLMARQEGLMLDPVYTGKAFAGLLDWVQQGKVKPGSTVVFWHTGGVSALFADREITGPIGEA